MNQKTAMQNRDLEAVFHPMTDMSRLSNDGPLMVVRGEGIYVYDENDNQYIDGLAGLWCTSLGYANKEIADTAYNQMKTLPTHICSLIKVLILQLSSPNN